MIVHIKDICEMLNITVLNINIQAIQHFIKLNGQCMILFRFKTIMQYCLSLQGIGTTENAEKHKLNAVFVLQGNQQV